MIARVQKPYGKQGSKGKIVTVDDSTRPYAHHRSCLGAARVRQSSSRRWGRRHALWFAADSTPSQTCSGKPSLRLKLRIDGRPSDAKVIGASGAGGRTMTNEPQLLKMQLRCCVKLLEFRLFINGDYPTEVEQDDEPLIQLAHAADVFGIDARNEVRRVLYLFDWDP